MESFKNAVSQFYRRYVQIEGRSNIPQYWWVMLYETVVYLVLFLLATWTSTGYHEGAGYWIFTSIYGLFALVNLIPNIALGVRRMHDIGKGGGWIFINLVPFIGWIWFLVLTLMPSEQGRNRFGDQQPGWDK